MTPSHDIIQRPRQCSADWLIVQARDLSLAARQTGNANLLIYASLEARNAIEQLWFELLMVINGGTMSEEMFQECRRRRDGFLAAIGEAEPHYRKLSRFTSIVMDLDSRGPRGGIAWDLGRLKKLWHSLSAYCHAQAHPAATLNAQSWIDAGHALVDEVYGYFEGEMRQGATAIMQPEDMTTEARMIWEDFAADAINEDQVRLRLKIVQPLRR